VGSTRADQSSDFGGTSIHSSRWGFLAASRAADSSSSLCCRLVSSICLVEPGGGGSEGPKSSSELSLSGFGPGTEGGSSDRGAGGSAGPMTRRGLASSKLVEELRRRFGGVSCASSSRLRLAWRWGGSCGPTVDILYKVFLVHTANTAIRVGCDGAGFATSLTLMQVNAAWY